MIPTANRSLLLVAFVLFLALLPLWLVRYPPLYDYPAHLLEAQVVARYNDGELQYAAGYRLNEGWPFSSNALSTLLMAGLALIVPAELAGRLALSLYIVLFVGGMGLLLRRSGAFWPLLLLAPLLAWNLAFTSGWLNFGYAVALGMLLLAVFQAWANNSQQWHYLVALALLSAGIAIAHLLGWALWAVVVAAMAAASGMPLRIMPSLLAALSLPLLPAVAAQPFLALMWSAIPVFTWVGIWLCLRFMRRFRLGWGYLCAFAPLLSVGGFALMLLLQPTLLQLDPLLNYSHFARGSFLLRSFALPRQSVPWSEVALLLNISALLLFIALVVLLFLAALQRSEGREPWLGAFAALILLYAFLPSRSSLIEIVEPRIVIVAVLLVLTMVGLPALPGFRQLIATLCCIVTLIWFSAILNYANHFEQQAVQWRNDLDLLGASRRVLTLHSATPASYSPDTPLNWVTSFYDGAYFSSYYFIEQGGYTTRMFGNGPIWLHDHVPGWIYYLPQPEGAIGHAEEQCALAKNNFDAVLAWGPLDQQLVAMLTTCLGEPETKGMVTVWRQLPTVRP